MLGWTNWTLGVLTTVFALISLFPKVSKKWKRLLRYAGAALLVVIAILNIPRDHTSTDLPDCTPHEVLALVRLEVGNPETGSTFSDSLAAIIGCVQRNFKSFTVVDSAILLVAQRQYTSLFGFLDDISGSALTNGQVDSLLLIRAIGLALLAEDSTTSAPAELVQNRWDSASACFSRYLQRRPLDATAWCNRGVMLDRSGRQQEAINSFDEAIVRNPSLPLAWYYRGSQLSDMGDSEGALKNFDEAIRLDSTYAEAWHNRAVALSRINRVGEAITSCETAVKLRPKYARAWCTHAVLLAREKRYSESLNSFSEATKHAPDFAEAWYNQGKMLDDWGKYAEALESLDKAIKFRPNYAEAWYNRGVTLKNLGRLAESLESIERALDVSPVDWPFRPKVDSARQSISSIIRNN